MNRTQIKIENAGFGYFGPKKEQVFENVDFCVNAGQILCLLGPNGTGKSTILKCLNNILKIHTGRITVNGENISRLAPSDIAVNLGYVPQSLSSAFPLPVRDIVVMGRATHISIFSSPSEEDMEIAETAMKKIGIFHLADRTCTGISGGEWQLVLIARALSQRPGIMLLDEPTSHLDLGNQIKILEVITQLARDGMAIIMATHFPDHAFLCADQVVLLKNRRIMALGTPDEVMTDINMEKVYGVKIKIMQVKAGIDRKVCIPILRNSSDSECGRHEI